MYITQELRTAVDGMLQYMEEPVQLLNGIGDEADWYVRPTLRLAAERALHVATETMTDAANLIIDALVMRDPGSYVDIIRVLAEESVVTSDWFQKFEGCLEFRNKLVHKFRTLTPLDVRDAVRSYAPLFPEYIQSIRTYLSI